MSSALMKEVTNSAERKTSLLWWKVLRPSASDIVFVAFGSETTEKNNVYTYCHTSVRFYTKKSLH